MDLAWTYEANVNIEVTTMYLAVSVLCLLLSSLMTVYCAENIKDRILKVRVECRIAMMPINCLGRMSAPGSMVIESLVSISFLSVYRIDMAWHHHQSFGFSTASIQLPFGDTLMPLRHTQTFGDYTCMQQPPFESRGCPYPARLNGSESVMFYLGVEKNASML